jgi:hypothetical protein
MRKGLSREFGLLALLVSLFVFPGVALAHGDEPVSVLAGPLSWVFMVFGGLEQALWAGLSGGAGFLGAQLMNGGNFRLPFLFMAGFYLVATVLFWVFFAGREEELVIAAEPVV